MFSPDQAPPRRNVRRAASARAEASRGNRSRGTADARRRTARKRRGSHVRGATLLGVGIMAVIVLAIGGGAWAGNLMESPKVPDVVRSFHLTAQNLSDEQAANARTIIGVGKTAKVGNDGIQIALMTALQESTLRNLNHGDRDSLGLFQQRPSQNWGTATQLQDPVYSARAFYGINPDCPNVGLKQVKGWKSMSKNDAAQKVQASGHPNGYEKWESVAGDILQRFADTPARS